MMQLNDITTFRKGQHLSLSERIEIQTLHRLGHSNRSIARILKRSHSTINSEIKRGTANQVKQVNGKKIYRRQYFAETGQAVYEKHRQNCKPVYKLTRVQTFLEFAEKMIGKERWSPDAVVGHVVKNQLFPKEETICTRTLYRYIDENLLNITNMDLLLKLRRKTKQPRNRKHKRILGESIENRPQVINDRSEFGHWEIDTVIGKKTKDEPVLLTITERLTRFELIMKLDDKSEAAVNRAIGSISINNPYFIHLFKSITADNGSEFASLKEAVLGISDVYFTHPYSSWERGTNENHNGIVRRFIPKGQSLKNITGSAIKQIASWMNNLPRKKLNYQTPLEAFLHHFDQIQTCAKG
jgi:IS30 family transposase